MRKINANLLQKESQALRWVLRCRQRKQK